MYSDAELDVDSDFAIKHYLKLWFDQVLGGQSQNARLNLLIDAILHVQMAIKPVKIDCFPISSHVLGCGIRWKIWFCHQTCAGSVISLRYGRSKSERALNPFLTTRATYAIDDPSSPKTIFTFVLRYLGVIVDLRWLRNIRVKINKHRTLTIVVGSGIEWYRYHIRER